MNSLKTDRKIKFQIMKDLNQAQLGDINAIYAHLNQHLTRLNMMPTGAAPSSTAEVRRTVRQQRRRKREPRRHRRRWLPPRST